MTQRPSRTPGGPGPPVKRGRRAGFSLIEMIAVTLLMALVAALTIPNLGVRGSQATLDEARSLASLLEFARQRAVMTGTPQRVVLDLDEQLYWLEDQAGGDSEEETGLPIRWSEESEIPMQAPRESEREFQLARGPVSRPMSPTPGVWIAAVDTAEGRVERGQVHLPFAWDGSSEGTEVWIAGDGGHQVLLGLAPLADRIRIVRVD